MGGVLWYKSEAYWEYFLDKLCGLGVPKQCPIINEAASATGMGSSRGGQGINWCGTWADGSWPEKVFLSYENFLRKMQRTFPRTV